MIDHRSNNHIPPEVLEYSAVAKEVCIEGNIIILYSTIASHLISLSSWARRRALVALLVVANAQVVGVAINPSHSHARVLLNGGNPFSFLP